VFVDVEGEPLPLHRLQKALADPEKRVFVCMVCGLYMWASQNHQGATRPTQAGMAMAMAMAIHTDTHFLAPPPLPPPTLPNTHAPVMLRTEAPGQSLLLPLVLLAQLRPRARHARRHCRLRPVGGSGVDLLVAALLHRHAHVPHRLLPGHALLEELRRLCMCVCHGCWDDGWRTGASPTISHKDKGASSK
jgi:hypothetical protein